MMILINFLEGHFFSPKVPDGVQQWYEWPTQPYNGLYCMQMGYGATGNFDDIPCGDTTGKYASRICRRTVGYHRATNGKYYKVLQARNINSLEARELCKKEGAQLANAPYGAEDNRAMSQYRAQVSNMGYIPETYQFGFFYVDGSNAVNKDVWILPNGLFCPHVSEPEQ
jgi:hypothetical protein